MLSGYVNLIGIKQLPPQKTINGSSFKLSKTEKFYNLSGKPLCSSVSLRLDRYTIHGYLMTYLRILARNK